MQSVKPKEDRKKVALNRETYEMLKDFCRFNGLKPRMVIATFTELMLQNEALSQQVIELTKQKQFKNDD
jgi:hypothetical protein